MKKQKTQLFLRKFKVRLTRFCLPILPIKLFALSALLLIGTVSDLALAQPKDLVGEIEFNEQSSDSPVVLARSEAKSFVEALSKIAESSSPATPGQLSDRALTYFNATYLYCTAQRGTCPTVLDGLLESEILNSLATGGGATCKVLPRFWRSWLNAGFEERQKYQTKTGFLSEASQFTNTIRPKYIKCDATLKDILASTKSFADRYGPQGEGREKISKLLEFLKILDEKKINVFSETGSVVSDTAPAAAPEKKIKQQ